MKISNTTLFFFLLSTVDFGNTSGRTPGNMASAFVVPITSTTKSIPIRSIIGDDTIGSSRRTTTTKTTTQRAAVSYEVCSDVGFRTECMKPLGIIFGENANPYFGVVIEDVAEGRNGSLAGLRMGDQLMSINGKVVVGKDFDSIMEQFQYASSSEPMELILFRGPVSMMYTILSNQVGGDVQNDDDDEDAENDDDGDEEVIMDENYESPVVIEVKEKKALTPGDFFKAAVKVGKMFMEDTATTTPGSTTKEAGKEPKKKQGFFGIGAESIQLEGNDANTLK